MIIRTHSQKEEIQEERRVQVQGIMGMMSRPASVGPSFGWYVASIYLILRLI
jgi:hypothetical protein